MGNWESLGANYIGILSAAVPVTLGPKSQTLRLRYKQKFMMKPNGLNATNSLSRESQLIDHFKRQWVE